MSILSKLFGSSKAPEAAPEAHVYKGFAITPAPVAEGGKWRIAARIEKPGADGAMRVHHLIRADLFDESDAAREASRAKAEMMIDQVGERVFD